MDENRLLRHIEPRRRIKSVGVGPNYLPDIRAWELGNVSELIDRLSVASYFQKYEGISIDVGSLRDVAEVIGSQYSEGAPSYNRLRRNLWLR